MGIGGIGFVVGKKWESNVAKFNMAYNCSSFSLSTLPLSQENLISQEEEVDSQKNGKSSIVKIEF